VKEILGHVTPPFSFNYRSLVYIFQRIKRLIGQPKSCQKPGRQKWKYYVISGHQQSWGYEDGPWKGPGPPLLVAADFLKKSI